MVDGLGSSYSGRRAVALIALCLAVSSLVGCVPNRIYNALPEQYLQELVEADESSVGVHLAIIEFDEFGMLWERDQLESAIELIRDQNAKSERGIAVFTYTHGWMNNADPDREENDLARFEVGLRELGERLHHGGEDAPDHIVGVYLGWRGATDRIPLWHELSFWNRKDAAERVASYQMWETLFRVTVAAKQRPGTKVLLAGHSMGGMILGKTLAPSLTTLLMTAGSEGVRSLADMVLLENPAMDGLSAYEFIDYLKRSGAYVELEKADGQIVPAPGPVVVSVTSEVDWVTRVAYAAGQVIDNLPRAFRDDLGEGVPSQGEFANRAHGHMDYLVSHRAWVEDGEVVLERVEGAYNDTPFWIVQVSADISANHGDIRNENFRTLIEMLLQKNQVYGAGVQTWIRQRTPLVEIHRPQ